MLCEHRKFSIVQYTIIFFQLSYHRHSRRSGLSFSNQHDSPVIALVCPNFQHNTLALMSLSRLFTAELFAFCRFFLVSNSSSFSGNTHYLRLKRHLSQRSWTFAYDGILYLQRCREEEEDIDTYREYTVG